MATKKRRTPPAPSGRRVSDRELAAIRDQLEGIIHVMGDVVEAATGVMGTAMHMLVTLDDARGK